MIAIKATYVELCKYTVTYVGLNFLYKEAKGQRNSCRSDMSVLEIRGTLLLARIGRIGAFGSGGSLRLGQNIAWKGSAPTVQTSFWRGH